MTPPPLRILRAFQSAVRRALTGACGFPGGAADSSVLLVAVSGGQDSVALLHALVALTHGRGALPLTLCVGHVDHGLRPSTETEREADHVQRQAAALGVPFLAASIDARAIAAREHRSLEDAARRGRYQALAGLATSTGAAAVATGHTASDQAETVLMRLLQGAGMRGLAGMRYRAGWPEGIGPPLLRPMLALTREQTAAYCAAAGLKPLVDPTNTSPRHTRNRLRATVMPVLAAENPRIVAALGRLAAAAGDAADVIDRLAEDEWQKIATHDGEAVELHVAELRALPEAVRRSVLERAYIVTVGTAAAARSPHLDALTALLARLPGAACQLPHGRQARRTATTIRLERERPAPVPLTGEWPLAVGVSILPGWVVRCEVGEGSRQSPRQGALKAVLRADLLDRGAAFSRRRPGDRIRLAGLQGSRSLQDVMVDGHLPAAERDRLPVLRAGGAVAWVPGLTIAGWALPEPGEAAIHVAIMPTPEAQGDAGPV